MVAILLLLLRKYEIIVNLLNISPHFGRVKNSLPEKQTQNLHTKAFLDENIYMAVDKTF